MIEEHLEAGVVASVEEQTAGAVLAADAAAGATVLALSDACDFEEAGGALLLASEDGTATEAASYLSADLELDTLSLSAPLLGAWPVEALVLVVPDSRERRAVVQLDADGEGVNARVPHALFDRLPLGSRDDTTGERVTLVLDGSEWVVDDVHGLVPTVDGSFIDPDTIPPPVLTDGVGPSVSPTPEVIGGIGALYARWVAPVNADPLTYDVHVSATAGFSPDATTFIESTPATSITIRKLPTPVGTPPSDVLVYDVPYYFRIVATDADGWAPVGGEGSGKMVRITSPDIAADSVTANHIVAGSITGELLAGDIVMGSKITTGSIDVDPLSDTFGRITGQRVEMDPGGLRVVTAAGLPLVSLPTDPGQDARFEGTVVAKGLTVSGGARFESTGNTIATDSGLTLAYGVGDPVTAPTLALDYQAIALQIVSRNLGFGSFALIPGEIMCMCETTTAGVVGIAQVHGANSRIWWYDTTTGKNVLVNSVYGVDVFDPVVGMTLKGGQLYYLTCPYGTEGGAYDLNNLDTNDSMYPNFPVIRSDQYMSLGNNGTNFIAGVNNSETKQLQILTFNWVPWDDASSWTTTTYAVGSAQANAACYLGRGAFDMAAGTKLVLGARGTTSSIAVLNVASGSAVDAALSWPSAASQRRAACWVPSLAAFVDIGSDGTLRRYSSLYPATGQSAYAAVTWKDTVGTAHESKAGPLSALTMVKRARIKVTMPPLPATAGGVDDPNALGLYMAKRTSIPTAAGLFLQTTVTPPAGASSTQVLADVGATGAAPPTTNNFPGANAGYIQSGRTRPGTTQPVFQVDGAGAATVDGLIPPGTVVLSAAVAAPVGWLLCDGSPVSRTLFKPLFDAISTRYGAGDGSLTFNLPNLKGAVPVGLDAAQTEFNALGKTGGAKTVALSSAEMPAHTHTQSAHSHAPTTPNRQFVVVETGTNVVTNTTQRAFPATGTSAYFVYCDLPNSMNEDTTTTSATPAIQSAGGGDAHQNLPPFQVLNYLIKT